MSGNVWHWTWDWWAAYPEGLLEDPTGPDSGSSRIIWAGGWNNNASDCALAHGITITPQTPAVNRGFRVVSR